MPVRSVEHRLRRMKESGVIVPKPATPRPYAHRKVTDQQLLAAARLGLSIPEIADKLGISTPNAHRRITRLTAWR
jgi:DNA-binding Lrp family transcriptional regulator